MAERTYGPRVTVTRSCSDCKACQAESYAVQGDSGIDWYCAHPSYEKRRPIGIFSTTPEWCPVSPALGVVVDRYQTFCTNTPAGESKAKD